MESTNELVKLFRDRLKYPIITVYSIILVLYNWDVLAIFFLSDLKIEDRIPYIHKHFSDPWHMRLWMPLVKAIFISILAPIVMWGLEYLTKQISFKRQGIKDTRNSQILTGKLQLAKLEFQIEDEKSGKKSLEELNQKIDELKLETQIYATKEDEYNSTLQSHKKSITELENSLAQESRENLKYYKSISAVVEQIKFKFYNRLEIENTNFIFNFLKDNENGFVIDDFEKAVLNGLTPVEFVTDRVLRITDMLKELNMIAYNDEDKKFHLTAVGLLVINY